MTADTALAWFGASMLETLFERFVEGNFEIEINDLITVDAVKAGLVEVTKYDPEQHTDGTSACEPGDDYYQLTEAGRVAFNSMQR